MTIGSMVRHFLTKLDWCSTLFPRIPVPIQMSIEKKLAARYPCQSATNVARPVAGRPEERAHSREVDRAKHISDEELSFGEAERAAKLARKQGVGDSRAPRGRDDRDSNRNRRERSRSRDRIRDRHSRDNDRHSSRSDRHHGSHSRKRSRSRSSERHRDYKRDRSDKYRR